MRVSSASSGRFGGNPKKFGVPYGKRMSLELYGAPLKLQRGFLRPRSLPPLGLVLIIVIMEMENLVYFLRKDGACPELPLFRVLEPFIRPAPGGLSPPGEGEEEEGEEERGSREREKRKRCIPDAPSRRSSPSRCFFCCASAADAARKHPPAGLISGMISPTRSWKTKRDWSTWTPLLRRPYPTQRRRPPARCNSCSTTSPTRSARRRWR